MELYQQLSRHIADGLQGGPFAIPMYFSPFLLSFMSEDNTEDVYFSFVVAQNGTL